MSILEKYPTLPLVMRHVDDEPSLAHALGQPGGAHGGRRWKSPRALAAPRARERLVDEATAEKGSGLVAGGSWAMLPETPVEQMSRAGQFPFASSPNGPLTLRFLAKSMRAGLYPYPFMLAHGSAELMIVVDICLRPGKRRRARC